VTLKRKIELQRGRDENIRGEKVPWARMKRRRRRFLPTDKGGNRGSRNRTAT